jgi:hypothetical protein
MTRSGRFLRQRYNECVSMSQKKVAHEPRWHVGRIPRLQFRRNAMQTLLTLREDQSQMVT